jgi:hypothetical protein
MSANIANPLLSILFVGSRTPRPRLLMKPKCLSNPHWTGDLVSDLMHAWSSMEHGVQGVSRGCHRIGRSQKCGVENPGKALQERKSGTSQSFHRARSMLGSSGAVTPRHLVEK